MLEGLAVNSSANKIWQYLSRMDSSLRPMKIHTNDERNMSPDNIRISVTINTTLLQVTVNEEQIYSMTSEASKMGHRWDHSGVHVIILSTSKDVADNATPFGTFKRRPRTTPRRVAMAQRFLTYQPAENLDLEATLGKLQSGRIAIVTAVPEWLMFLGEDGEASLESLGFEYASKTANGEPWVGVAITGRRAIAESLTCAKTYPANALYFETTLLSHYADDDACEWHSKEEMKLQAEFCQLYDGYGDLCQCNSPFTYHVRLEQPEVPMDEPIPVVVVTANKPKRLYRLLHHLFTMPGSGQTDFLAVIDGDHQETLDLLTLLKVPFALHKPQGFHNVRTNTNVRFALYSVFSEYSEADKAILLEDDLIPSPDLLRFFHQTSWILNNDSTVFCINAFNSNSLPNTASDATKLLRSESFPMYGWMVRRQYALQAITKWISGEEGDWDWYLMRSDLQRGRDVVSPEVSRTLHAGSAGAHVDGFEQHLFYNRMLVTTDPQQNLEDLQGIVLDNYLQRLKEDIAQSQMLTPDPREEDFLPEGHNGPFVVFVRSGTRNDEFFSFRIFMMSLRTYYWDTREIFRGVMRFNIKGRILYVVGCPLSQDFCSYNPEGYKLIRPTTDLIRQVRRANDQFEQSQYVMTQRRRATHRNPAMEASLENLIRREPVKFTRQKHGVPTKI